LVGWLVAVFGFGLHVGALALAPLSIVQAVLISDSQAESVKPNETVGSRI